jgi:16S rRNA (cytosine967-C5)-methyltransferase
VTSANNSRALALRLLFRWEAGKDFADELLHSELRRSTLPPSDRKLLVELFYGVIRWRVSLDWVIAERCKEEAPQGELANLLRLGVYQILLLDRVPDHAAVNETVGLATGSKRGFANAVLRRVAREKSQIQLAWEQLEKEDPATAFSHPKFLVERWQKQFGLEATIALLKWNNEPPAVYARVNELRTTPEELRASLRNEGVIVRDCPAHPLSLEIESPVSFEKLATFQSGHFYIQDPSTLLAVDLLDPQPGETVLDACAAPGGKTTYIAQKMKNQGAVVAMDSSATRLKLVTENSQRLGVSIVHTQHSALSTQHLPFDRILIDAPCSNTGVLRRRADLRWRIQGSEIRRLAQMQRKIVDQVAPMLKRGGRLVYSTCSLESEENEQMIQSFLAAHDEFAPGEQSLFFPPESNTDGGFTTSFGKR